MHTYSECPVCKSKAFAKVLTATDYTVSKEQFDIHHCNDCQHRFTNPVPKEAAIGPYYQSEEYISHSNTSKGLINRLYHIVRKRALRSKRKLAQSASGKQTGRLLDIGSGAGAFLAEMKAAGWTVDGIEPDEGARAVAKKDFGVIAQPSDAFFGLEEGQYDVVTMWHVLEHVHQLDGYMEKIAKLLKPGGTLLIAVPNYNSLDAERYKAGWAAYDVPRHLYHFCKTSMQRLLERHQYQLRKIRMMPFDSFYVCMLSERYKNGSMIRGIWNGFCSYVVAVFKKERCSSIIYVIKNRDA